MSKSTVLEIVLREGRNREIRRMAARIGHKVLSLRRIAMGPLRLGDLPKGAYRELTTKEVKMLRELMEDPAKPKAARRTSPPPSRAGDATPGKRAGKSTSPGNKGRSARARGRQAGGHRKP
jgi:23S rRNA pseudouridine2605 synthase